MITQANRGINLVANVSEMVRDAHTRWEHDCLALDHRLGDVGLPFGATGYKLAVELGAYRLVEGATLALNHIREATPRRSPDWSAAHRSVLDAIEGLFLASSRLIPAPAADPVLSMAFRDVKELVIRHYEQPSGRRWLQRLIGRWRERRSAAG